MIKNSIANHNPQIQFNSIIITDIITKQTNKKKPTFLNHVISQYGIISNNNNVLGKIA